MHLTRKLAIQSVLLASAVSWAGLLSTAAWAQAVTPGGAGSMTLGSTPGFSSAVPATAAPAAMLDSRKTDAIRPCDARIGACMSSEHLGPMGD